MNRIGKFHPGAIYATNYKRTRDTVEPLARKRNKTVQIYDASNFQVCQSEPANDLALFLSTVLSLGLTSSDFDDSSDGAISLDENTRRARFETAMSLSDTFLREYERHCPVSRQRVALWAALDILMLVLHGWIKVIIDPGASDDVTKVNTDLEDE